MGFMFRPAPLGTFVLLCVLLASCGGGGGRDGSSLNPQLTDPAVVATSTPISREQVFLIRDNGISAPTGVNTIPAGDDGNTGGGAAGYTVVSGDTCGAIATSLGVSVPELIVANPAINEGCTNLVPDQILTIPGATGGSNGGGSTVPTPTAQPSGNTHTVASGDTCFDIAGNWGVSTDALIAANNGLDCNALQPDQVLQIP
jgi:LysM repeat protein